MADTLDVLSLAEAKRYVKVGASDTSADILLPAYITAISRKLDRSVGPIVRRTITNELHDGGDGLIQLRYWPVATITTVTEYQGTNAVTLSAETPGSFVNGYLAQPYAPDPSLLSGELWRRNGAGGDARFSWGRLNIKVTYTAGRFSDTASVDERFKQAAGITLSNLWRMEQESVGRMGEFDVPALNFPGFAIPKAARQLLADEWQYTGVA